ncbi:MAG: hypothetical protein OER88_13210, partial [Planctomycetota bacterium]|nr:hypothetical protein [Planctomycetota bacterium]
FVSFYIRAARRWKLSWLLGGSLVSCVLALLFFWILLGREIVWSYPLFSIWVGMYGVIATSQVWTLANELFTTREAKRVFGVVGAGGVLGGIVGAYSVRFLAGPVGTVNLLLIAAGLLTLALVLALVLVRLRLPVRGSREPTAARERLSDSLAYVAKSHHLRTIAGLVFVTALATKIVDWQFNTVAAAAFADKDALSGFFGTFYGTAGVLGLALQLFVTSRILQRFGLGTAVLVFPILLALGTGTLLLPVAGLAAAVLVRGSDAVLKHSLDRSSRELAFLPVPRHRKASAKSSIDMVVDRAGDGAAGFLQLGLIFAVTAFGGSLIQTVWVMAWVNLGIVALWVVMARRLRVSYVDELKRSIARGRLEVGTWYESLAGADTVVAVRQSLESGHRDQVIGALDVLVENPQWDCSESLAALAGSTDTEIRARALALLLSPEHPELPEGVARTFADEDRELLRECLDLQLSADPEERLRRAEAILDRAGGSSRGAWIALMVRRLGPEFFALTRNLMEELLRPDSPSETREVAATAIGMLPRRTEMHDMLLPLLDDADARVASAAARSGGAVGDPDLLRRIVPLVGRRGTRRAARQALQAGREASLPAIAKVLDAGADVPAYAVRLPRVLAGIPSANAFAMLLDLLSHAHPGVAGAAIRAIYRLRVRHPDREPVSENALLTPLGRQVRALERLAARRLHLEKTAAEGHPLDTLLASSIDRAEQGRWDMVFKLLALRLSPRRTLDCRRGILDGEV